MNPSFLARVGALVATVCALARPLPASGAVGPLRVLTTTTDLAEIVRAVGGDAVDVQSLCAGPEDPHFLDARPSFVQAVRRADLVVVVGMGLEEGYMPLLLRDAANPAVRPGAPGHLDASTRIRKLQVPVGGASRALGHVHAEGNPHYLLDPANAGIVAEDVARALARLRPASAATFEAGAKELRRQITDLLLGAPTGDGKGPRAGGLVERFRPWSGAGVVAYHDSLVYLTDRLGLEVVGTLEPKPGVPPTAAHVADLAVRARAARVRVVAHHPFQPVGPVQSFAAATGAQPVLLAHQPGAVPGTTDLLATYRHNAEALIAALGQSAPR